MLANWRIIGLWRGGRTFLIVVGQSRRDCYDRLIGALDEYTDEDFGRIEAMWHERWHRGSHTRQPGWVPESEVSMPQLKRRLRNREGWSVGREA